MSVGAIRKTAIVVSHARGAPISEHFAQTAEPRLPRRPLCSSLLLLVVRPFLSSVTELSATRIAPILSQSADVTVSGRQPLEENPRYQWLRKYATSCAQLL